MPTEKIYKKVIEISEEINRLGLNGWETNLSISNKKKKEKMDVKVIFKIKKSKLKQDIK